MPVPTSKPVLHYFDIGSLGRGEPIRRVLHHTIVSGHLNNMALGQDALARCRNRIRGYPNSK